jgi:hypothetical protein
MYNVKLVKIVTNFPLNNEYMLIKMGKKKEVQFYHIWKKEELRIFGQYHQCLLISMELNSYHSSKSKWDRFHLFLKDTPSSSCSNEIVHMVNIQNMLFYILRPLWLCANSVSIGILFPTMPCWINIAWMIEQGCLYNESFISKDFRYPGGQ